MFSRQFIRPACPWDRVSRWAFTLVELLVVLAVLTALMALLLPAMSKSRQRGRSTACLANLRTLGQGLALYADQFSGNLVPGRLPRIDDDNWRAQILGSWKYRPTFLAMMGSQVGVAPFEDPMASKNMTDRFGQPGDQQDYSSKTYVCPDAADWLDERNGSYGYNYQFLGNARLRNASDPVSFKNWPVKMSRLRSPGGTVAVADGLGTAASFPAAERMEYSNNGRDAQALGNEGFNLDPPRVDPANGEMADLAEGRRSSADARHLGRVNVLWADSHASSETMERLGYRVQGDGVVTLDGNNTLWSPDGKDEAWVDE